MSVGDTLYLMILLCVSKSSAARFLPTLLVVAFTGQHFHFSHCSVESEVYLFVYIKY